MYFRITFFQKKYFNARYMYFLSPKKRLSNIENNIHILEFGGRNIKNLIYLFLLLVAPCYIVTMCITLFLCAKKKVGKKYK